VSALIDAGVLFVKDASQDADILVPCASWMGKIGRALKRGGSMQELGEALQRSAPRISNERATRLAGWIASHSSDAPHELLEYARVKDVDVVALLRRAVAGCADIAVACAYDRMVIECGVSTCIMDDTADIAVVRKPSPHAGRELCDKIRRVVSVVGKKQCAEYSDVCGEWSSCHAHMPSLAWPITDWLLSESSATVDWSSAEVGKEVERCGMLHERRAAVLGVSLDLWGLAYDASMDARFVSGTDLRVNSPSANALYSRCRGEAERRWGKEQHENVWEHLEAGHREMQRAIVASAAALSSGEGIQDIQIAASTSMLHVVAALEIGFHHWSSHAMRELQLSARDPDIVALLSSDVVFDSFVVVKDQRANVLMDHAEGFQRFTHTWGAIVACKSLFLTMREMLNVSKHAGLLQVEVSVCCVFVGEVIITCWCVCSVWQIWWDCITLH
jgi:hypothetical protein